MTSEEKKKPKRVHPSGASKRKARKQREEQRHTSRMVTAQSWGNLYATAGEQFDPNAQAVELPVYGVPPAKLVAQVNGALAALEQGQFFAPALLYDSMMRDDRVSAKCEERIDRLVGSELVIEPADESSAAQAIADDLAERVDRVLPTDQLTKLMRYALGLSVGIAQVMTDQDGDSRTPTLRVWSNRYLRYDWLLRCFMLITQNKGEIPIREGDPEWIIYQPFGYRGWLDSAKLRSIALPWLIRTWVRTWWARFAEVHGMPIRAGIIPADRQPADERVFLTQLSNLAHEAVIRLPQGQDGNRFDLKLIESTGKGWEGFLALLAHCDDAIAITYLGQSTSTKGMAGLGAQADAGEATTLRLTRKDAKVAGVLREQYLKPWCADNYGNPDLAPRLRWEIEPPEDEERASITDFHVAQALGLFKSSGAPIDVREYLTTRGYPLLTEAQHAAQKAAALEEAQAAMMPTDQPDEGVVSQADDSEEDDA